MFSCSRPGLVSFMGVFLCWSLVFFGVRVFVRWTSRQWSRDDWLLSFALVASITFQSLIYRGTCGHDESTDHIKKLLYASQLFYLISTGLSRLSAALLIRHIARLQDSGWVAKVLVYLCSCWTALSLIFLAVRSPLGHPWTTPDCTPKTYTRWLVVEAAGSALELGLWLFPMYFVWRLNMRRLRRLAVSGVFSIRLLLVIILAFRLRSLATLRCDELGLLGEDATVYGVLTAAGVQFSIMASCMVIPKMCYSVFDEESMVPARRRGTQTSTGSLGIFGYLRHHPASSGLSLGSEDATWPSRTTGRSR